MQLRGVIQLNANALAWPLRPGTYRLRIVSTGTVTMSNLSNGTTVLVATATLAPEIEDVQLSNSVVFTASALATVFVYE